MAETTRSTANQVLRYERERRGWSQQEVADRVGTTPLNVGRWERGITQPGPHFRQKLSEVFEKSMQELGLAADTLPATRPVEPTSVDSSPSSLPAETPASFWNVPYRRNPFFTGREDILRQLYEALTVQASPVALAQPQAISGLGGIGKTQTAIEYAHRYRSEYSIVLWARADSYETLVSDYLLIATLLKLPQRNEQDQSVMVQAVKRWFDMHENWLLILDNADNLQVIEGFLPAIGKGHVLLTTRSHSTGTIAQRIELEKMPDEEALIFLLRRIKRLKANASLESVSETVREQAQTLVEVLDGLPLALDQAGAYIEETDCSLSDYLKFYKTRRHRLLRTRGKDTSGHPEPVATTWSLSFEKVERANSAAAELLRLCAFLHPDEISETMIMEGAAELGPILRPVAEDEFDLNEAIGELHKYSLIKRDQERKILNMHRLVQAVIRDEMGEGVEKEWAERVVRMMSKAIALQPPPSEGIVAWPAYQQYFPHIQVCAQLIKQYRLIFSEGAQLLYLAGVYLYERGHYLEVEPFLDTALKQREALFDENSLEVAGSLNRLARLYYNQCKFTEAERLFRRALAIREKQLGPEHADIAETLNFLGELYNVQGKNAASEPVYKRAIEMRTHLFGPEHPLVAQCLNNLSWLYVDEARFAEAELLTQQALNICEKAYGPVHLDVAYSLNCMSWLYFSQKQYSKAEPLLERALKIYEELYGSEHPTVGTALVNLARVYQEHSQYEAASALYQRALDVEERLLGRTHPDVAQLLHNLGQLYYLQGQYERAEALYLEALDIAGKTMGTEHSYIAKYLSVMGVLYTAMGRYHEAQSVLEQSLALREKLSGADHPDIATTLEHYVELLRKTGRESEAEALEQRIHAIRAKQP